MREANLTCTGFREADLRGANLREAFIVGTTFEGMRFSKQTKFPAPTVMLQANWCDLPPLLVKKLMRYDADNHPDPKAFFLWARTGRCPYAHVNVERSAHFEEDMSLITPSFLRLKVESAYTLMKMLLKERCQAE
jgi:hypothetical protein